MNTTPLAITLEEDETRYYPGEEIRGVASWQLDHAPQAIDLRLFWYTRGKGTQDVQVLQSHRIDTPSASGQSPFLFTLPHSPYSFSGKLISLIWAIEMVVLPEKLNQRIEITVSPTAEELLISPQAAKSY